MYGVAIVKVSKDEEGKRKAIYSWQIPPLYALGVGIPICHFVGALLRI
jgi:hypothetical protein